jgi:molybdate/tungstate transport system substrate-binding protein
MSSNIPLNGLLLTLSLTLAATAQTPNCAPSSNQQLIIYRAGSLTAAFMPLEAAFTCQTGIHVKDVAMGSVDAKGKMVLAYSENSVAERKLPPIAKTNTQPFHPPNSIPRAAAEILTLPGVAIGGGQPFLDPGAYRAPMIFQLAEAYYKVPNLYNNLLEHFVISAPVPSGDALGKRFDFQFTYEHSAQATASTDPDYRYVNLPDEINMSDPAKNAYYRQHAVVVLPGLGTPRSARTIAVPGTRVAWGITLLKDAPNRENAIKFLQLLLSPTGTTMLKDYGPAPLVPALVSSADFRRLPGSLRPLVKRIAR